VIGEHRSFEGPEAYLAERGVTVEVVDDPECAALMDDFTNEHPDLWNEDIGV
jgi:cytosine deaminase